MKQLTELQRAHIKLTLECGVKPHQLAKIFNVTPRTIKNIAKKENIERKKYDNKNRFKITEQNKAEISQALNEKGKMTSNQLKTNLRLNVSKWTINRACKELGFDSSIRTKNISEEVIRARYEFCSVRKNLKYEDWKHWVFTDKCTINSTSRKRQSSSKSRKEDKNQPQNCSRVPIKHYRMNLFGVLTFKEIKIFKVPNKFTSEDYLDLLERNGLADHLKETLPGPIIYQQDNSKVPTTPEVTNYLNSKFKLITDWPSDSPDLNIMDRVWAIVKTKIKEELNSKEIRNENELLKLCEKTVKKIPKTTINTLFRSIPAKIKGVIKLNGNRTI